MYLSFDFLARRIYSVNNRMHIIIIKNRIICLDLRLYMIIVIIKTPNCLKYYKIFKKLLIHVNTPYLYILHIYSKIIKTSVLQKFTETLRFSRPLFKNISLHGFICVKIWNITRIEKKIWYYNKLIHFLSTLLIFLYAIIFKSPAYECVCIFF